MMFSGYALKIFHPQHLTISPENENEVLEVWLLLTKVMMFEDGYVRYDYDPKNPREKHHPLNHVDICYTKSVTFKLGLKEKINKNDLMNILDNESECYFLNKDKRKRRK